MIEGIAFSLALIVVFVGMVVALYAITSVLNLSINEVFFQVYPDRDPEYTRVACFFIAWVILNDVVVWFHI